MRVSTFPTRWVARAYRIGLAGAMAGALAAVPLAAPAFASSSSSAAASASASAAGVRPLQAPLGSNYSIVMQANTNVLWFANSTAAGGEDSGQTTAPGTSPAVTALATGGQEIAWQNPQGTLDVLGSAGNVATGLAVKAGTSPSITDFPTGGYEVAFQGANGHLWSYGTQITKDWGVPMDPKSSPAIGMMPGGYFQIAFNTASDILEEALYGYSFVFNTGQALAPGTSPSVCGVVGIESVIAFQDTAGTLAYFSASNGRNVTSLPMMAGSSPSISAMSTANNWQIAYESNNGSVATYGTLGQGVLGLGMLGGTNPSITGLASGGYEIAFQANTATLWVTGSLGTSNFDLGMAPGSSPAITATP